MSFDYTQHTEHFDHTSLVERYIRVYGWRWAAASSRMDWLEMANHAEGAAAFAYINGFEAAEDALKLLADVAYIRTREYL